MAATEVVQKQQAPEKVSGIEQRTFQELILVHTVAWWVVQVLFLSVPYQLLFAHWEMNSPERWGVRLARTILAIAIVLAWTKWRRISLAELGLGGQHFWTNFAIGAGCVAALWVTVATVRGADLRAAEPIGTGLRVLTIVGAAANVVAQQLSTFGLLQSLGSRRFAVKAVVAFALAWLSFGIAHLFLGSSWNGLAIGLSAGLLFGLLLWKTKILGAGLGVHFGFYLMLAALGFGVY